MDREHVRSLRRYAAGAGEFIPSTLEDYQDQLRQQKQARNWRIFHAILRTVAYFIAGFICGRL